MNSTRKENLKINDYFIKMKSIADNMAAAGSALNNDDLILHILSSLGPEYNSIATYITGQVGFGKMNVNEAYAMLLTQEARIEQQAQMLADTDVKQNFEVNLVLNRGFKKGNMSGGKHFGGYGYNTGNNRGFGTNHYKGNYGGSGYGFAGNGDSQYKAYQGDNQRGGGGNWNPNASNGGYNGRPSGLIKPQWNGSKPTCQICLKTRHTANICWKLTEFINSGAYRPPPNRNLKAAYLANIEGPSDANWYLDSGATHHLTNDMNNMHVSESFTGTSKLIVGNGAGLSITHLGSVVLKMHKNRDDALSTLKLNDMLLVPQITKNLISISRLTKDNNIVVEFTDKFCFVKDKMKNVVILQGKAEKSLYRLLLVSSNKTLMTSSGQSYIANVESTETLTPLSMFSSVSSEFKNKTNCLHTSAVPCINSECLLSTSVLHQRLGHPSSHVLNHIIKTCSFVQTINGNKTFDSCDACKMGKMHRLHFPATETKTKFSLEILHTDLWGPSPVISPQGYRYHVSFVDECTRFTWIFPLKIKDETLPVFKIFKIQIEKQLNRSIKCL